MIKLHDLYLSIQRSVSTYLEAMSARPERATTQAPVDPTAAIEAGAAETSLAEGNSYCVASPDNPLRRNLVVSIRARPQRPSE